MATLSRGTSVEITEQLSLVSMQMLARWIGCFGVIWNAKVAENLSILKSYQTDLLINPLMARPKLNQKYAHYVQPGLEFLKQVPSQILRNASTKAHEAFNACVIKGRKRPKFKGRHSKRNCLITRELFDVELTEKTIEFRLKASNKSAPISHIVLPLKEGMTEAPAMIWVTRKNERYFISYSYTKECLGLRTEAEILEAVQQSPKELQESLVVGLDVGVIKPVALSLKQSLDFTDDEKKSLKAKEARRLKYQKKLSRQQTMAKKTHQKMGKNARKTKAKLADMSAGMANIRVNMAHRVSKAIAELPAHIIVCESLNLKGMTKRPKPKQDPKTQEYLPNGARAKAGLNKSILNVAWGQLLTFTEYKLKERDKLLVRIDPRYSSQECSTCGHIDKNSRLSQDAFHCTQCGHTNNADYNAAQVLKQRFLEQLNTNTFVLTTKVVKKIAIRRQKAARTAVSVCGADVSPISVGCGVEAETSKRTPRPHLIQDKPSERTLEAHSL